MAVDSTFVDLQCSLLWPEDTPLVIIIRRRRECGVDIRGFFPHESNDGPCVAHVRVIERMASVSVFFGEMGCEN